MNMVDVIGYRVAGIPGATMALLAALFFASDEPSFIAGVDLPVDGGRLRSKLHFARRIDVAIAASRSFLQRYRNESALIQQARFII